MSKQPDIDKVRKYLIESGYPEDGDALLSLAAVEAELAPKASNPHGFSEILADMDLIIEQEHGSESGARSLKEHLISFRARIESALASAEPVAWIRFCSDGSYEGPIHDSKMGGIRRRSGKWQPLYAHAPPAEPAARMQDAATTCWQHRPGSPCPTPDSCRSNGCSAVERELFPYTAQPAAPVEAQQREALLVVMRACDAAKQPCGSDPESSTAIRNGTLASIAAIAAQGLAILKGPPLAPMPASVPDYNYIIERIAASWDECMHVDSLDSVIDIGADIRDQWKQLVYDATNPAPASLEGFGPMPSPDLSGLTIRPATPEPTP